MAGAVAGIGSTGNTAASASPMTLTYTLPGGEGVFAFTRHSSTGGVTTSSVSDGTNSYTAVGADLFDGGIGGSRLWYCPNTVAVTGATLSATWSASTSFRGLGYVRYTGLDSNAVIASAKQAQNPGPGTAADAVTSTATSTVTQPNMFFGVAESGQALSAGTSPLAFTDDGTFTSMNSGAGLTSRVESFNTSATTGRAATFKLASNDITHSHVACVGQSGGVVFVPRQGIIIMQALVRAGVF